MYFKITNAKENHNGFQYKSGLNVLDKKFEPVGSCVPGGLYFTLSRICALLQNKAQNGQVELDNRNAIL